MAVFNIQPFSKVISTTSKNSLNTCRVFYLYKVEAEEGECVKRLEFTCKHDIMHIADMEPDAFLTLKDLQSFIVKGNGVDSLTSEEFYSYEGILYFRDETRNSILVSCPQDYLAAHDDFILVGENLKINDYAFYAVKFNEVSAKLPFERFVSVGDCTFGNSTLQCFKISNQLDYLGKYAFANCLKLKNILAEEKSLLQYISTGAFYNCVELESVQLPEGLIYIGEKAFQNCKSLKRIILPKSLQCICKNAFLGCNNIELIVPPDSHLLHLGTSEILYLAAEPDMNHSIIFPDEVDIDDELSLEQQNKLFAFYQNQYKISKKMDSIGNVRFSSDKTLPDIVRRYEACQQNAL